MARRLTISDVAKHVGVSKGAVSFALNGRAGVSSETRARILAAADELGWQPSHRARSLSVSRAFAFGLVLAREPELLGADPFYPAFIAGVQTILAPTGYSLLLHVVSGAQAEEAEYRKLAGEGRVDAVFVSDLRTDDSRIALLSELGLPAVTLGRPDVASPFPAVCMDDRLGIQKIVGHLVELGHTRIGHVSGPLTYLHALSRRDAWADALVASGLGDGPFVASDFTAAGGAAATAELLGLADPPTAIVYANDPMAIAGLGVAHNRGLRVPEDLSLTGFDGTELGSYLHPPLTTVTTNPLAWGKAAAATLLAAIGDGDPSIVPDVHLEPARAELRGSTAAPRNAVPAARSLHRTVAVSGTQPPIRKENR